MYKLAKFRERVSRPKKVAITVDEQCPHCLGLGYIVSGFFVAKKDDCLLCDGSGVIQLERIATRIPAGENEWTTQAKTH
ncbi:hypothetical protein [Vibrio phage LP.2]|nr:hypothetical protein [Vibrio phage LP.2]